MQRGVSSSNARSNGIGIKMDIGIGIVIAVGVGVEVEVAVDLAAVKHLLWPDKQSGMHGMEGGGSRLTGERTKHETERKVQRRREGTDWGGQGTGSWSHKQTGYKNIGQNCKCNCICCMPAGTHTAHTHRQAGGRAGWQALPELDLELHLPLLVAANFGATK